MVSYVFRKAFSILMKKPFMLWGVSLLSGIISIAVNITGVSVPIITIPITATLSAGMAALYLDGYNEKDVNSKQLFKGFSKECIGRVPAGMLWHQLWSIIWAFVPVAGIVKSYSYSFTPYILLTRPEVSQLDALKISMQETKGYKARMFGADLLAALIYVGVILVFALIMIIPVLGTLVGFCGIIAASVLFPLFSGLIRAGMYQEALDGKFRTTYYAQPNGTDMNAPTPGANVTYCTNCGAQINPGAAFCTHCGTPKK